MTADTPAPQKEPAAIASRASASAGLSRGGRPPFGYRRENGKLVPDQKTAPIRRLIYELFVEHKRLRTVARILNERGYLTATGKTFSRQTVVRIIRDTTAKGLYRPSAARRAERGGARTSKEEGAWRVPPIVSAELWEEANTILNNQRAERTHIGRPARHLFSGFVRCACGGAMYVPTRTTRYRCRTCTNGIPAADLEDIFLQELDERLRRQWKDLSARERRDIVELLTKTITVGTETVSLEFRCLPSATGDLPGTSP